jgi:acyl-coenzyme A thioesterase PaaI-like protein
MSAAPIGALVRFDGYVLKQGKRMAFTAMDVRRVDNDALIAQARHTKAFK